MSASFLGTPNDQNGRRQSGDSEQLSKPSTPMTPFSTECQSSNDSASFPGSSTQSCQANSKKRLKRKRKADDVTTPFVDFPAENGCDKKESFNISSSEFDISNLKSELGEVIVSEVNDSEKRLNVDSGVKSEESDSVKKIKVDSEVKLEVGLSSDGQEVSSGRPSRRIKQLMDYKCLAGLRTNMSYDTDRKRKKRTPDTSVSSLMIGKMNCSVTLNKKFESKLVPQDQKDPSNKANIWNASLVLSDFDETANHATIFSKGDSKISGQNDAKEINSGTCEVKIEKDSFQGNCESSYLASKDFNFSADHEGVVSGNAESKQKSDQHSSFVSSFSVKEDKSKKRGKVSKKIKQANSKLVPKNQSSWNSRPYDNDYMSSLIEKVEERMKKTFAKIGPLGCVPEFQSLGSTTPCSSHSDSEQFDNEGCSSLASVKSSISDNESCEKSNLENVIVINDDDPVLDSSQKALKIDEEKNKGKTTEPNGVDVLLEIELRKKKARNSLAVSLKKAICGNDAEFGLDTAKHRVSKSTEDLREYYKCKRRSNPENLKCKLQLPTSAGNATDSKGIDVAQKFSTEFETMSIAKKCALSKLDPSGELPENNKTAFVCEELDDYLAKNHSQISSSESENFGDKDSKMEFNTIEGFSFVSFKSLKSLVDYEQKMNADKLQGKSASFKQMASPMKSATHRKLHYGYLSKSQPSVKSGNEISESSLKASKEISVLKRKIKQFFKRNQANQAIKRKIKQFSEDCLVAMGLKFEANNVPLLGKRSSKKRGIVITDEQNPKGRIYGRKFDGRFASKQNLKYHVSKKRTFGMTSNNNSNTGYRPSRRFQQFLRGKSGGLPKSIEVFPVRLTLEMVYDAIGALQTGSKVSFNGSVNSPVRKIYKDIQYSYDTSVMTSPPRPTSSSSCLKEFCRLGCVCECLQTPPKKPKREHCGRPECMIECRCKYITTRSMTLNYNPLWSPDKVKNTFHDVDAVTAGRPGPKKTKRKWGSLFDDDEPYVCPESFHNRDGSVRKSRRIKEKPNFGDIENLKELIFYDTSLWLRDENGGPKRRKNIGKAMRPEDENTRKPDDSKATKSNDEKATRLDDEKAVKLDDEKATIPDEKQHTAGSSKTVLKDESLDVSASKKIEPENIETISDDDSELEMLSDEDGAPETSITSCARTTAYIPQRRSLKSFLSNKTSPEETKTHPVDPAMPHVGGNGDKREYLKGQQQAKDAIQKLEPQFNSSFFMIKKNPAEKDSVGLNEKGMLLETYSDCDSEWQKFRDQISRYIYNLFADHAVPSGRYNLYGFCIEIRPKPGKGSFIPGKYRKNVEMDLLEHRCVKITKMPPKKPVIDKNQRSQMIVYTSNCSSNSISLPIRLAEVHGSEDSSNNLVPSLLKSADTIQSQIDSTNSDAVESLETNCSSSNNNQDENANALASNANALASNANVLASNANALASNANALASNENALASNANALASNENVTSENERMKIINDCTMQEENKSISSPSSTDKSIVEPAPTGELSCEKLQAGSDLLKSSSIPPTQTDSISVMSSKQILKPKFILSTDPVLTPKLIDIAPVPPHVLNMLPKGGKQVILTKRPSPVSPSFNSPTGISGSCRFTLTSNISGTSTIPTITPVVLSSTRLSAARPFVITNLSNSAAKSSATTSTTSTSNGLQFFITSSALKPTTAPTASGVISKRISVADLQKLINPLHGSSILKTTSINVKPIISPVLTSQSKTIPKIITISNLRAPAPLPNVPSFKVSTTSSIPMVAKSIPISVSLSSVVSKESAVIEIADDSDEEKKVSKLCQKSDEKLLKEKPVLPSTSKTQSEVDPDKADSNGCSGPTKKKRKQSLEGILEPASDIQFIEGWVKVPNEQNRTEEQHKEPLTNAEREKIIKKGTDAQANAALSRSFSCMYKTIVRFAGREEIKGKVSKQDILKMAVEVVEDLKQKKIDLLKTLSKETFESEKLHRQLNALKEESAKNLSGEVPENCAESSSTACENANSSASATSSTGANLSNGASSTAGANSSNGPSSSTGAVIVGRQRKPHLMKRRYRSATIGDLLARAKEESKLIARDELPVNSGNGIESTHGMDIGAQSTEDIHCDENPASVDGGSEVLPSIDDGRRD